jgi:hypothetical protein
VAPHGRLSGHTAVYWVIADVFGEAGAVRELQRLASLVSRGRQPGQMNRCSPRVGATRAHVLSADRVTIHPWPGRTSAAVTGRTRSAENATDRIPEHITGPLIKAAAFYVQTASGDILAARGEITTLQANRQHRRLGRGDAEAPWKHSSPAAGRPAAASRPRRWIIFIVARPARW